MDQFSFQGPFAYRWIDDVPVERIDLRSGERRPIEVGKHGIPPAPREARDESEPSLGCPLAGEEPASPTVVRAAMAAWN